jgi:Ca-activated chloride channel family protein
VSTLLWPELLVALAALPVLVGLRVWMLRRRRATGVRFSSLSLVREAVPGSSWIRRHLPFALFVLALGSLVLAMARPAAIVAVPTSRTTVVLAMDVSRSMCATDIPPNRLVAAEKAAAAFVEQQASGTQIGIVAFAGFAEIVQVPTNEDEVLLDVIAALATGRRTAIGSAILESIDAIAETDPSIPKRVDTGAGGGGSGDRGDSNDGGVPSVPRGAYAPAIIVLLTDGASNTGPDPVEAAAQAAARGIRVYTIGFGTENPDQGRPPRCGAQYVGREPGDSGGFDPGFGGGFGGGFSGGGTGGGFRRAIDEDTLRAVADATGGTYYPAESAEQLNEVFAQLPTNLILQHDVVEVSVAFTALAAVLVGLAVFLGQAWRPLP